MMNRISLPPILSFALFVVTLAGCSKEGPDLVDPNSEQRRQISLFAIDQPNDHAELLRYSELSGIVTATDYATANNGELLDRPVDAIYEDSKRLYLHHRIDGSISVLDLETRKKTGQINGFPYGVEGQLSGMAFSNYSQAWVICYGSPNLYHIDQEHVVIADTIPLPHFPTSVGTVHNAVFVGMEGPNGTGKVAVLHSNPQGGLGIERTFDFPTPIIYMFPSSDARQCLMLSAGAPGQAPRLYYIDITTMTQVNEHEMFVPPLTDYIGLQPNFADYTHDDYLYLATPSAVIRFDTKVLLDQEWITGFYPIIGVDFHSGLLYAYNPQANVIRRRTADDEELEDLSVPATIRAIQFLGSNMVIR